LAFDAIIISDCGTRSLSGTNPLRLSIDGRVADIQTVMNYVTNGGQVKPPIEGEARMSWASAPKLNGIYLYSFLTRRGFNVELIDSFYDQRDEFARLLENSPRSVVISTTFFYGKQTLKKMVDDIRELAPDICIIAGGPFVYLSYLILQRTKDTQYDTASAVNDFLFLQVDTEPDIDRYIVSLRGERILADILDRIGCGAILGEPPNSVRFNGTSYDFSGRIDDLANEHDVAMDWQSLPDSVFESGVVPMQASLGCPYHCAFCNFTKDRRLTYVKPLDDLLCEMQTVARRGIRYIWFVDDNFRLGKRDIDRVCRRLIDERIDLKWMTFIRASTLKTANLDLLKQAGCIEVQLGIESADSQILENMNKKATPELYDEVIPKVLAAGINCSCYFIIGFPGETEATVRRTREFLARHELQEYDGSLSWSVFPFFLSPLSPIYEPAMRRRYGLSGYMGQWQHRTMNSEEAKKQLLQTFFDLDNSGPIYRGDNLDMLSRIGPRTSRRFAALRHRLSKASVQGRLDRNEVYQSFAGLLGGSAPTPKTGSSQRQT
jgi:anaerobic magnesium-protoporphyrin IX monomethyl ester cyclase